MEAFKVPRGTTEPLSQKELVSEYRRLLEFPPGADDSTVISQVSELRKLVLNEGIPDEEPAVESNKQHCTLRGSVWKVLLNVQSVDAREYIALVDLGPCSFAAEIEKDVKRTLNRDPTLAIRAPIECRTRILNAFFHWSLQNKEKDASVSPSCSVVTYSQGMGSLVAALLFTMSEVEAFASFRSMMSTFIPKWYSTSAQTIRTGCALADKIMRELDPPLHAHLMSLFGPASTHAELMFFSRISSLYANRPPLSQIVRLWDAVLAFGIHLVILLCAAEAIARRAELLAAGRDSITRFQGIANNDSYTGTSLDDADRLLIVALELVSHLSPETLHCLQAFMMEQSCKPTGLAGSTDSINTALATHLQHISNLSERSSVGAVAGGSLGHARQPTAGKSVRAASTTGSKLHITKDSIAHTTARSSSTAPRTKAPASASSDAFGLLVDLRGTLKARAATSKGGDSKPSRTGPSPSAITNTLNRMNGSAGSGSKLTGSATSGRKVDARAAATPGTRRIAITQRVTKPTTQAKFIAPSSVAHRHIASLGSTASMFPWAAASPDNKSATSLPKSPLGHTNADLYAGKIS